VPASDDRCSLRSLAAGESLAGTASTIRHWLLIEHPGPWGGDGLLDARLPAGLGRDLRALESRTGARVLLIRPPGRVPARRGDGILCIGVDTGDAWRGSVALDRIEDAVALDPRVRSSFPTGGGADPLFVVCTHGRRDPCCAERGRPVAGALGAAFPDATWESTHVGGDRFAGNLVAFPHGLYFGRVEPGEAPGIAGAYADGRIGSLERYRGRSRDPFPVQAAERAVREHLGLERIDDIEPVRLRRLESDVGVVSAAEVVCATPAGPYRVRLDRVLGAPMRLTCHASAEGARRVWHVTGLEPDLPAGDP
jgi:hypothetical protein